MENYRAQLEVEKVKLEQGMEKVGRKKPGVPDDFEARASETGSEPDLVDQADIIKSYEENEGILRDLEARYDQVLAAQKRIEEGTYGICTMGGEKIEPERLAADPAADTCIAHASAK